MSLELSNKNIEAIVDGLYEKLKPDLQKLISAEVNLSKLQTLSVDEVAEKLQHDKTTVYRLIEKKLLKGFKSGREWRVSQQSLNDYINGSK